MEWLSLHFTSLQCIFKLIFKLLTFPLGNHVCFLCLWVCFCFVNKLTCIISLDPTKWCICLSLSDLLHLYDHLWVHPCCCKWQHRILFYILFYGQVVFHCIYVPHLLYSFTYPWTLGLFPWVYMWADGGMYDPALPCTHICHLLHCEYSTKKASPTFTLLRTESNKCFCESTVRNLIKEA